VIAAALDVVRPAAGAKGVTLAATLDVAAGVVLGDPVRLQQVAWNLLANAVKFTPRGGRVDVRLTHDASWLRLEVKDTGEGIPVDFLPHVFERFRQADTSSSRAHGGLGLGLAIVKHLVELHGGTVTAESRGPGRGASFSVSLPLCEPARAPERSRISNPHPPATPLDGMHVLVVDDEPDSRELSALVLQDHGASVWVAASAAEGLRLLERHRVDVMVADIDMPGENGYDMMRRAVALVAAHGRRVPALALTGCVGAHHVREATRAGFRAHVAKPVTAEQLVQAVAQLGQQDDALPARP
jgi:CheY-like chemotaxis protein